MDYGGGRTTDEIVSWVNKKTGPLSKAIKNLDDLKRFRDENKVAVVFMGKETDDAFETYKKAAGTYDKLEFAHYDCDAQCQTELTTGGAQLVLFKKFDNNQDNFLDSFEVSNIKSFIDSNSVPKVIVFEESYIEDIFGKAKTTLFLFTDKNS